jgi:hypothetical protein
MAGKWVSRRQISGNRVTTSDKEGDKQSKDNRNKIKSVSRDITTNSDQIRSKMGATYAA